jgi:sigma-B regulation protein RsbU (phosphoserine phosphatase)
MPEIPSWQLAASLRSARETSGDFYDIIQLPNGLFGLLIADVVDKGVPAALLMAMSWSLIWSYAIQHPDSPHIVFEEVNRRLLLHLGGSHFLTCFYAILNPETGSLTYCNAGQPPPLHLKKKRGEIDRLSRTGPPLGVLEESRWDTLDVIIGSGETLILYTDGVTDSCNTQGEFYGTARLNSFAMKQKAKSAQTVHNNLLANIDEFVTGEVQFDDTALIVLRHT